MTMARHRFAATAKYNNIDIASRAEGASPHQLVAILFEEFLKALDEMAATATRGDLTRLGSSQSRALSVLHGLSSSLDMDKGGEVAATLAAVYAEARRATLQAARERNVADLLKVREMIGEVAEAWRAIG